MEKKSFQLWCEAYEDAVRKAIQYPKYKVKSTTPFVKLAEKWVDFDPVVFMQANFPPYRTAWQPKHGKWVEAPYPFALTLLGDRSKEFYLKYSKESGITSGATRREAITNAVTEGLRKLSIAATSITDFQRVWDLYGVGMVSGYLLLLIPGMRAWIQKQMRKSEITLQEWSELREKEKVLDAYDGLNIELFKLIKGAK